MTKALGMVVYLRLNTVATNIFSTVCATSIDGSGVVASAEDLEPCLSDTMVLEVPGDPKYNQQTIEYKKVVGSSGISANLEAAVLAKTEITYAVKFPETTPIYATRTAYAIQHVDLAAERTQDLKSQLVLAPQSAWTYSTTAPATA